MAPSPISPNSSRHGRRASVAKIGKARGRGYSVVDERESLIAKALTWELKRTVKAGEEDEESEDKLVDDAEGWVECEDLVSYFSFYPVFHSS
jgi:2'-phosphotransferase